MKNISEYYKKKTEEIIDNLNSQEKELKQKINGLNAKIEVISNQLTRYRSSKNAWGEEYRDSRLQKGKSNALNDLDEIEMHLQRVRQERNTFLENKKTRLENELRGDIKKYTQYLKFSEVIGKELEKKKLEIDAFGRNEVNDDSNGKKEKNNIIINIKSKVNRKIYQKNIHTLNLKNDEYKRFRDAVKDILDSPSTIYNNNNRETLDSFYDKYKEDTTKFTKLPNYMAWIKAIAIGIFIISILIVLSSMSVNNNNSYTSIPYTSTTYTPTLYKNYSYPIFVNSPSGTNQIVAQFNGQNSGIMFNSAPLNQKTNWTWSGWVYAQNYNYIYSEGNPSVTLAIYFTKGGALQVGIWNTNYPGYWMDPTTNNNTFNLGKWYYIDISLNNGGTGSGVIRFYANGQLILKTSGQMEDSNAYYNMLGNGYQNGISTPFEGYISDIQIYNSTLSLNEIQTLYQEGIEGVPIDRYNLIGWWPLNGNIQQYHYTNSSYENNNTYTTTTPTISSITRYTLLNFSKNTLDGTFCLVPDTPYVSKEYPLTKGENVTWVINQSAYFTTIILDNQSEFDSFVNMVQNASALYTKYENTCNVYPNYTTTFCKDYSTQNPNMEPYISVESGTQDLNPVMESLPQNYIDNITFIAPITGNYFFIILNSRQRSINFASSSICYTDSYIYNTT